MINIGPQTPTVTTDTGDAEWIVNVLGRLSSPQVPTVTADGTPKGALLNELDRAIGAVEQAMDAVRELTINDENYPAPPCDAGRLGGADQQRRWQLEQIRVLDVLLSDLIGLNIAIGSQPAQQP